MQCFDIFIAKTVIHYIVSFLCDKLSFSVFCRDNGRFGECGTSLVYIGKIFSQQKLLVDRTSLTSSCISFLGFENGAHDKNQIT